MVQFLTIKLFYEFNLTKFCVGMAFCMFFGK